MSINTVVIEGYANHVKFGTWESRDGGDPVAWCSFSLNHSSYAGRDDDGKSKYNNNYFNVRVKGKLAEVAGDFLADASQLVVVQGKLSYREFTRDDGSKGNSVEIQANEVSLGGRLSSLGAQPSRQPVGVGASSNDSDDEPF